MATAAQIKSAIRSQSQLQREVTRSLAGVESTLSQANLESQLAELEQRQRTSMYAGLASGVEVLSTLGEGLKQKKELEENIRIFEESLPEGVRKAGGLTTETPERASLIDVIRGKEGSLTSFLYGEEEQYKLGENILGTKYDVAAMGERIKAEKQADLLERFEGGEPLGYRATPTFESSLNLDLEGNPTIGRTFNLRDIESSVESLEESIDKPLRKKSKNEMIADSEGGPLRLPEQTDENKLTYFSKDLSYLNPTNPDAIMTEDSPSAYEVATEIGKDDFVENISESEKISKPKKVTIKDFGKVTKKFSTPERAIGEIDKQMQEISKLRDESRYSNKTSLKNALEEADRLEEKLKKNISSIYNPKTGKFRSEDYKQMFEEGKYLKGDVRGVGEKEGFANISRRVEFAGIETPFQTAQEINLTNIQNFINQLFPKDLASR